MLNDYNYHLNVKKTAQLNVRNILALLTLKSAFITLKYKYKYKIMNVFNFHAT